MEVQSTYFKCVEKKKIGINENLSTEGKNKAKVVKRKLHKLVLKLQIHTYSKI